MITYSYKTKTIQERANLVNALYRTIGHEHPQILFSVSIWDYNDWLNFPYVYIDFIDGFMRFDVSSMVFNDSDISEYMGEFISKTTVLLNFDFIPIKFIKNFDFY